MARPGPAAGRGRRKRLIASGIRVWLTNSEASSVRHTVMPSSWRMMFISLRSLKITGRKTITEVSVAAMTATETSRDPSRADDRLSMPFSW